MAINKNVFLHDSDKAALAALQAIPGFTQLLKAFLKIWDEKLMRIQNMSTNMKLSENQLSKYYNMLPPICEKLGIKTPDLYLKLDVVPNAWTSGDNDPFIVITSGLIETMPEELIPTILAHECGHIVCHHVLYRTMGQLLLNGALNFIPLDIAKLAITPIKIAFAYWMRCSEFSADRAAIMCDGTPDKIIEMCARFAGFDKDIEGQINLDEFMNQAKDYRELVGANAVNKVMEFMMFNQADHPINAVRAYEANEWSKSDNFIKTKQYFDTYRSYEKPKEFPVSWNERHFLGKHYEEVENELIQLGFENVDLIRKSEKSILTKEGSVINVDINGTDKYKEGEWVIADSRVEVTYYLPMTDEEEKMLHPNEIKLPNNLKSYIGNPYKEVEAELFELGFENVEVEEIRDITKEKDKNEGKVAEVTIDKSPKYSKGEWISQNADVKIIYHSKKQ